MPNYAVLSFTAKLFWLATPKNVLTLNCSTFIPVFKEGLSWSELLSCKAACFEEHRTKVSWNLIPQLIFARLCREFYFDKAASFQSTVVLPQTKLNGHSWTHSSIANASDFIACNFVTIVQLDSQGTFVISVIHYSGVRGLYWTLSPCLNTASRLVLMPAASKALNWQLLFSHHHPAAITLMPTPWSTVVF